MILQSNTSTHSWPSKTKTKTLANPASKVGRGLQAVCQLKQPEPQDCPSQESSPRQLSLRAAGGVGGQMPGSGLWHSPPMPGQHLRNCKTEGSGSPQKVEKEKQQENRKTSRDGKTNEKVDLAEKGKSQKGSHSLGTRTSMKSSGRRRSKGRIDPFWKRSQRPSTSAPTRSPPGLELWVGRGQTWGAGMGLW